MVFFSNRIVYFATMIPINGKQHLVRYKHHNKDQIQLFWILVIFSAPKKKNFLVPHIQKNERQQKKKKLKNDRQSSPER